MSGEQAELELGLPPAADPAGTEPERELEGVHDELLARLAHALRELELERQAVKDLNRRIRKALALLEAPDVTRATGAGGEGRVLEGPLANAIRFLRGEDATK